MSEIVFKSVAFRNFLSFGNVLTTIDLTSPGTTLIVGENLDDGGSSGAGKTTGLCAISYCLFDKVPSGITKDRLINQTNSSKSTQMEVMVEFLNGKDEYKVHRWRGASSGVKLFCNGVDVTPANVNRGEDNFNDTIENLLGFSYNLFSKIILFNGNSRPFLSLAVGEQRALVEELLRITLLSKKANALKRLIKETEKSIDLQKLLIKQQTIQNDTHRRHLAEARSRVEKWTTARDEQLVKLDGELSALSAIDFDGEEQLHAELAKMELTQVALNGEINELKAKVRAIELEVIPEVAELQRLREATKRVEREFDKLTKELEHLRDDKCPYCLQGFADAKLKVTDIESKAEELALTVTTSELKDRELSAAIETAKAAIMDRIAAAKLAVEAKQRELTAFMSGIDELKQGVTYKTLSETLRVKASVSTIRSSMMKLSTEVNPHDEAVRALVAEGEVKIDQDLLDGMLKLLEHQQFLLKLLTDKNSFIRKNIISKTIPFLNKRIGYYTERLNLPHVVLFQPDMTCQITQLGRELDHGNLSNGEQKRLNLSLCLAFRDVLTYLHAKVNVLFADEVDGGSLDSNCVDALVKLLKSKSWDDKLSIFVISHRPEFDDRCDRNVVIRKEKGFSTMITQPT